LALLAGSARADPRLDEKVYLPYVEPHVLELETRWAREDGASSAVVEVEYGLSDRLTLAALGQSFHQPGRGQRLSGLGLEGVAYLGQIPGVGVDAGVYLEYRRGLAGEEDVAEGKLLLAKTVDRFQGALNLIVEKPVTAPKGQGAAGYGYAASLTWRTLGNLRLGAEAFGDLGDDRGLGFGGAYVGPQVKWEGRPGHLPVELAVDAGWLAAVGPARREGVGQARVGLEIERRF
jgi:hypothetical protein